MTPEQKDYVAYRLERARQSLHVASRAKADGNLNDAVNRLYYACFYAASALLTLEGKHATKHKGVLASFDVNWVRTGRLPSTMGRFFHRIFESRLEGDYDDFASFSSEQVEG